MYFKVTNQLTAAAMTYIDWNESNTVILCCLLSLPEWKWAKNRWSKRKTTQLITTAVTNWLCYKQQTILTEWELQDGIYDVLCWELWLPNKVEILS